MDDGLTDSHRRVIGSGMLIVDSAAVRILDILADRNAPRRILASDVSPIRISLEDSRPARIRGYGAMPASTADALEADLQAMLQIAHRLRALLSS